MTGSEIALIAPLYVSVLGALVGLIKVTMSVKSAAKKTSVPPPPDRPDCQPCNDSVDRLCTAVERSVEKQDRLLLSLERFIAKEEGRRDALARTGEFPVQP